MLQTFLISLLLPTSFSKLAVFDDSILYSLQWPGGDILNDKDEVESIIIKSKDNEKYRCLLPKLELADQKAADPSEGPDPAELLSPLLFKKQCSLRIEPYWIYELCHGRFLRQYHEDHIQQNNKPNTVKVTEYFLGHSSRQRNLQDVTPLKAPPLADGQEKPRKVPTLTFNERVFPYYGVSMYGGTPCDLEGMNPRQSVIKYICKPSSPNQIVSLLETTTCEYEVIVQTPLLCDNPAYVPKDEVINNIECHAMDGSPRYPEVMSEYQEAGVPPAKETTTRDVHASGKRQAAEPAVFTAMPDDPTVVRQFLAGEYCLKGGSGWWHFEVCNGQYVKQFHVDRDGHTNIYLGYWNEEVHKDWYTQKFSTKKKKSSNYVVHYYAGGDICDITQQPRNVQVKLRCLKDASLSRVTVSLEEQVTCQYILTVEAAIICELLETVDEYGIFSPPPG